MSLVTEIAKDTCMNVIRAGLGLLRVFPIKKNRVIFTSYNGNQYSCNPKCISECLQQSGDNYEVIWAFLDPQAHMDLAKENIKVIKNSGLKFWYYRLTSRVSVTNVMWRNYTPVRKKQYEIQTWHGGGGGYKKTLNDDKAQQQKKITLKRHLKNFERYSLVLTSSATSLRTNARMAMQYKGVVLGGTPRNDMLINQNHPEISQKVREHFHLNANTKIALYAPTWRAGAKAEEFDLDYARFKESLHQRFGGEWIVLRRFHWMAAKLFSEKSDEYICAEDYPDMQELLYAADVLVSDYSSSIWDYSFTCKPCFLFCLDLANYEEERDFYNPITTWGFPVAQSNEELFDAIREFNQEDYSKAMENQHIKNTSFETGHATENVCRIIHSMCFGDGSLPKGLPYHFYEEEV